MQLFVLILNKTECLPKLLGEFLSAGIKGRAAPDIRLAPQIYQSRP